ncbi:inorganic diphosphatase [Ranunculus cassubicifolius]
MGVTIITDLMTQIFIPVCVVLGIVFSLLQWYLVSQVKMTADRQQSPTNKDKKNGFNDYVIEEEEGVNDHNVVAKCSDFTKSNGSWPESMGFLHSSGGRC